MLFSIIPVVYGPSVCPEDTNENNECVFYDTDILMFPLDNSNNHYPPGLDLRKMYVFELIEKEKKLIDSIDDLLQERFDHDNPDNKIIKRENIWFSKVLEKHTLFVNEIQSQLHGNFTNSEFGLNEHAQIDYTQTNLKRSENPELQSKILNENELASREFCEKFGKFVTFPDSSSQNQTEIKSLFINDVKIEFGEYSNSDPCVDENDFKITISSKDSKILDIVDLLKKWIEN